ncbi:MULTISPECIES: ABC transporter substrate-binding protein [Bosea]|uniref:ABC transporter substrate-binding protein n=1 Tax=Bosea TaxID=85413 RepID=UPI00214F6DDB|nr:MULTISPECIES: ABC transporter substrate-binding protein [Bosea]MCR4522508.1 ABC transporter substrate-binding protein [Bosea sp. 47.2.35]MDR6829023.1 peptide/nickel transport system substrate-binding protein [Bosea robiniae]MDR6895907.1 peptide/nickel transport system substrate-binding protein [Bosea sp. BE109]MDR7139304.1 peptide/nickel transport system substrate-binding protein [Bosea sp. BE168]MDR7176002.1 peptide/nickel transport system substrate-binding protein [Bosea sp. BE271]
MKRRDFLMGTAALGLAGPTLLRLASAQASPTLMKFVPQANLSSLDPVWTTATVTNNHGYYVFDMLYGADENLKPQPQMAEGHEVSADGKTWRIKLREGLSFHDGTPVMAIDCAASLKRWTQRDPYGQLLGRAVEEWGAPDDRTVEIKLKRPFPMMLDCLAKSDQPPVIMPERLAKTDANTQVTEMVGSGPYKFVASGYVSGSKVVYEKFEGYKPRAEPPSRNAGGKVAHFQRIEWNVLPDPATAAAALTRGEVDWWERPLTDLQPMLASNKDIKQEVIDKAGRGAIIRLNHLQAPFNNPKVRAAVRMAVKQEDYMRAAQGDDTTLWQTCRSLWWRGTPYYDGEQEDLMPQSLEKAKAALKASGYNGEKVVIINPTDFPDIGPLGEVTFELLKQLGMNVEMAASDWGTVVQRRGSRESTEKGGWSIFHTTGSATSWGNPAMSTLVRGQGDKGWFGWWKSDAAEALAEEWLYAPDEAAQRKSAKALARLALEEVATIPLGQFVSRTAYRKDLTGMLAGSAPYPWGLKRG